MAGTRYSTISSTARLCSFVALALRIVRNARAVRPCLPMTLPRSVWATRSSITVTRSPATSVTFTFSGSSTSAFATYSISSFNHHSHCSCLQQLRRPLRPGLRGQCDQFLHGVGGLRPLGDPRPRLLAIDGHLRRVRDRGVVADDLDEAPLARRPRGGHDHAVARPPARAFTSPSNGGRPVLPPPASENPAG